MNKDAFKDMMIKHRNINAEGWRDAKNNKPDEHGYYLCAGLGNWVLVLKYYGNNTWADDSGENYYVTEWMPIPERKRVE